MATLNNPANWSNLGGVLQKYFNNSKNVFTNKTPNEVFYDFIFTRATYLVLFLERFIILPKLAQIDVADAIAFAQMSALQIYDKIHQSIL